MENKRAPVAQLDRAIDFESIGREFEPLRARQQPSALRALRLYALNGGKHASEPAVITYASI